MPVAETQKRIIPTRDDGSRGGVSKCKLQVTGEFENMLLEEHCGKENLEQWELQTVFQIKVSGRLLVQSKKSILELYLQFDI